MDEIPVPPQSYRLKHIFIVTTPKGGSGKTETADCLEAALSLTGLSVGLVDVDDGNRGLLRRVGKENVIKLDWSTAATAAPDWASRRALDHEAIIFDLGAGIDSSDLPIMSFLGSVWRLLADHGVRITVCAVISTNAHTSAFLERLERKFDGLGTVVPVLNNQDGSASFQNGMCDSARKNLRLGMMEPGFQIVRLSRKERLSAVIANPAQNFRLASAFMGHRVARFARHPVLADLINSSHLKRFGSANGDTPELHYTVRTMKAASDYAIEANARLKKSYDLLLDPSIKPHEAFEAITSFQKRNKTYKEISRG